jgi:uncharacterized membrane protein YccC
MRASASTASGAGSRATPPVTLAGVPVSSWALAIRVWIGVVVALYAGFWLQLETPYSAAITVAILALPTRGQALEKAGFRLMATVIGVAASIVIVGVFSQARDLLLLAFAAWLGLCVYAAGLSDGNRAYAAVLSGYTVALVAIQQIDTPQLVFDSAVARGGAIVVGIAAIAVVNDVLAAPDRYLGLESQLASIHRRVSELAREADAATTAALMREIATLRSDMTSLATESSSGRARSAAARSALVALVAELHAVRTLNAMVDHGEPSSAQDWAAAEVLRRDQEVCEALAALDSGGRPAHLWRAPFFRSHRLAAEAGVRAALWLVLAAAFFVLAGWPAADASLATVAILIGLGATAPDARGFTVMALIAMPIAAVLAGVLEFLILDGATEFPLLAMALGPFVIGATVLMTLPNQVLSSLGRLNLIFILAIVRPSNPPSYDAETFLFTSLFVCLAAALSLAAQLLIPPVSGEHRRRWLLASARRELTRLPSGYAPEEAMFRDAMRIAQIAATATATTQADLDEALALFDQAGLLRLGRAAHDA